MNVKINIETVQYDENKNKDLMSINAEGTMYEKNNDTYIVYKEKEDGLEITNTIKVSKDEITIKKFGSTNSTMKFKKGETDLVKYRTVHGLFIIENSTKELQISIDKDNIKIKIEYNIKVMDLFNGTNEITINIRKVN